MSVAEAVGKNLIRMGAVGAPVMVIQAALHGMGYPLRATPTGYFGPGTDTAVRAFQRKAGLTVDGVVGPETAKALDMMPGIPAKPLTDIRLPLWTQAALELRGIRNAPGNLNQEVFDWLKESEFKPGVAASVGKSYFPWCALGMNHFLARAGQVGTGTLWALDFADPKKWPGVKLPGPAVGAIVPMERQGGGHVTSLLGKDQHGNPMCLGANQSHAVTVEPFSKSRFNKGFWWPANVPLPQLIGWEHLPLVTSDGKLSTNES